MAIPLMKSSLLAIAAFGLAARFGLAQQPAAPAPAVPPPPAVAAIPDFEDSLERAAKALSELDADMADRRREFHLRDFHLRPMPPIPPMPALAGELDRLAQEMALLAQAQPPQPPHPVVAPSPSSAVRVRYSADRGSEEGLYRNGQRHLDRREYDSAVEAFDAAAAKRGPKADGAQYWKAYALAKLGRRDEALAAVAELEKSHPNSRWLNDAKALAVEVRQASGQTVSPESQSDEDIKLMAINALMNSDPDRAIPLLETMLSRGGSPKLKEKALFVLAQSRMPQAREVVVQYAKGKGNPDMQYKAVEYLGMVAGKDTVQLLSDVYSTTNDPNLKRRILYSYVNTRDTERLFNAAKNEPDAELRREAIQLLGASRGVDQLTQLYAGESNVEVRESIMHGLVAAGASDKLIDLAKTEKEPRLRSRAIRHLGGMSRTPAVLDALVAMYASESDKKIKQDIIGSLASQRNVTKIVEIARKESDPELKRQLVQILSQMRSKEATDYLLELLNK